MNSPQLPYPIDKIQFKTAHPRLHELKSKYHIYDAACRQTAAAVLEFNDRDWRKLMVYTDIYRVLDAIKRSLCGFHLFAILYLDWVMEIVRTRKFRPIIANYSSLIPMIRQIKVTRQMAINTNELLYSGNINNVWTVCEMYGLHHELIETVTGTIINKKYIQIVKRNILDSSRVFMDIRIKSILEDVDDGMLNHYTSLNTAQRRYIIGLLIKYEMFRSMCRSHKNTNEQILKNPILDQLEVYGSIKTLVRMLGDMFMIGHIDKPFVAILDNLTGF
jgi:hypothetical protein